MSVPKFDPVQFLSNAEPSKGNDVFAVARARNIAGRLLRSGTPEEALELMLSEWSPRCKPPWSGGALLVIIKEAERAHKSKYQDEDACEDQPTVNVAVALAEELGVSERRVYQLKKEKTTSRERAKKLATIYGGKPDDFFRRPGRRGRHRNIVAWFMKLGADDFPFRDFIIEAQCSPDFTFDVDDPDDFILEFRELYKRGTPPDDFENLELMLEFARYAEINGGDVTGNVAAEVWRRFKQYRIGSLAALAASEA